MHKVRLHETARRHRRGADAHATRRKRTCVAEHRILVQSNVQKIAQVFHLAPSQTERAQIPKHQVVIRTASDEVVALGHQRFAQRSGVRLNLLDVRLELRGLRILERDRQRADLVVVRTALQRWKDGHVDARFVVVILARLRVDAAAEENHPRTRTAKRLVRRRRHDVTVFERLCLFFRGNQTGDVRHIHHQHRPALVGNFPETCVIPISRVRRTTANDHLRSEIHRLFFELIVIDVPSLRVHLVRQRFKEN